MASHSSPKQLLIIRHAIAMDRTDFVQYNLNDSLRPLTKYGKKKMEKIADHLRHLQSVDLFLQSPLLRSQQTVKILSRYYPKSQIQECAFLHPKSAMDDLFKEIAKAFKKYDHIAIVGHESQLSHFFAYLLTGNATPFMIFKKGGIARIDFDDKVEIKKGALRWLLTPQMILNHS